MKYFKIPSGEITNLPYLIKIGKLKKKLILSTGMSNMKEIGQALKVLIFNGTPKKKTPLIPHMMCHFWPFKVLPITEGGKLRRI